MKPGLPKVNTLKLLKTKAADELEALFLAILGRTFKEEP
jgi:hypothetical protein